MYKYDFLRKTCVEMKNKKRTDLVNQVANLLLKGNSQQKISEILRLSQSSVLGIMKDIDEETLR